MPSKIPVGTLAVSLLLATIPLIMAGVLLLQVEGVTPKDMVTGRLTIDGLFMTLILLALSGIFGLNALMDLRQAGLLPGRLGGKQHEGGTKAATGSGAPAAPVRMAASDEGVHTLRAKVENVLYFEAEVGQRSKSLVTLARDSSGAEQMIFAGDVRNVLPKGKRLEITFRTAGEYSTLLEAREA